MVFQPGNKDGEDTQFKPGQSGNPDGMKKGFKSFKQRIKEMADKNIDYKDLDNKKINTTAGDALVIALFAKAVYKKDTQAAKILMEHVEAKKLEHSGNVDTTRKVSDEDRTLLERMGLKVDD